MVSVGSVEPPFASVKFLKTYKIAIFNDHC